MADEHISAIKKFDIAELKKLPAPPVMVKDVMELVCILLHIKPEKARGGESDYWKPAGKLLHDMNIIKLLKEYDAWNLQGKTL